MDKNFVNTLDNASENKQACKEEEFLDTIDNLKQEETDTLTQQIQSEDCHSIENFVNVSSDNTESNTIIKTEIEEEDPLHFVDDSKQDVKANRYNCHNCEKNLFV